jgi:hypothetical protein
MISFPEKNNNENFRFNSSDTYAGQKLKRERRYLHSLASSWHAGRSSSRWDQAVGDWNNDDF